MAARAICSPEATGLRKIQVRSEPMRRTPLADAADIRPSHMNCAMLL